MSRRSGLVRVSADLITALIVMIAAIGILAIVGAAALVVSAYVLLERLAARLDERRGTL
jgi:predicted RND superfamily exporter protein